MAIFQSRYPLTPGVMTAVPNVTGRKQSIGRLLSREFQGVKRVARKLQPKPKTEDSDIPYLDLCWIQSRMCPTKLIDVEFDDDMPSVIPGYKALCANISTRQVPTTAIGYMPFLPLPPTSETVVAEALKICLKTSKKLGQKCQKYTIVSQDLVVYMR